MLPGLSSYSSGEQATDRPTAFFYLFSFSLHLARKDTSFFVSMQNDLLLYWYFCCYVGSREQMFLGLEPSHHLFAADDADAFDAVRFGDESSLEVVLGLVSLYANRMVYNPRVDTDDICEQTPFASRLVIGHGSRRHIDGDACVYSAKGIPDAAWWCGGMTRDGGQPRAVGKSLVPNLPDGPWDGDGGKAPTVRKCPHPNGVNPFGDSHRGQALTA